MDQNEEATTTSKSHRDSRVPSKMDVDKRVDDLMAELTLDEKLSMMDGDTPFWPGLTEMTGGGYADHPWVAGAVPRLGIEGIRFADGPRGVVMEGATTFPVTIARGATWDIELEERVGDAIGVELRALGANFFGGVCINLLRHPAWGRAQETYGEDPVLLGAMGAALARGVERHAMACVKHFAVNSMENARFTLDVRIDPRTLHEMYLPHFKQVLESGVSAVMSAYNSVNGEWCGQSRELLTEILKERWRFDGFVISDFIFGIRDARKAALSGQDIEMPFQMHFHSRLKELVESGEVPKERVDDAVRRILRRQLRLPPPGGYDRSQAGSTAHEALSREVAEKSIVLLKNENDLLPLAENGSIAVIGRLAATPNLGDTMSSSTRPVTVATPLDGIQEGFGKEAQIVYDDGADLERAAAVSSGAETAILVVGYTNEDEGEFLDTDSVRELSSLFPEPAPDEAELARSFLQSLEGERVGTLPPGGDRDRLTLRPADEALIEAVAAANPRTIVVVMGGSAIIMESWRDRVPAILMLWYPGMEGGHALADVLAGRVNPSARLPVAIPRSEEHLSYFDKNAGSIDYDLWHGYRLLERDGHAPAFPFGFGLGYTRFHVENLSLNATSFHQGGTLVAGFNLANVGDRDGEEVVQVYVSARESAVERAPRELKAFRRVRLAAGELRAVEIEIRIRDLAYFDVAADDFVVEAGAYELYVARHSLDEEARSARFVVEPI
jgi:beta-glucosidase